MASAGPWGGEGAGTRRQPPAAAAIDPAAFDKIRALSPAGGDDLLPYERTLLDAVAPEGGEPVLLSQLPEAVGAVIVTVQNELYDDVVKLGWFAQRPDQTRNTWFRIGLGCVVVAVLATIGLNGSLTFYDSMLVDTTSNERMDRISSHGYAWGYIGSTVPFIVCIALIFGGPALFGWSTTACTRASFVITALWWVAFTIPLLTSYKQVHYRATAGQAGEAIRGTFAELGSTFRAIRKNKPLWMFMIAFFFYIDGVHTVISMATSYGSALGIDSTQLVLALLVTQFVAFPCSIIYGKLAGRFGSKTMITAAVVAYMCIVFFAAFFLRAALEFWILAILVGMFQGGIQALSRSYYGKIIPKDHANEYYGFYDIFGKTASIIGTFLVATTTSLTGNASLGVLSIAVLLVAALAFLLLQKDPTRE